MISRADVAEAMSRIGGRVRKTPVLDLAPGTFGAGDRGLILKLEVLQHTGAFKARGAFNRILANQVPAAGVIAASGGNAGAAVAYAASTLGHRAEIFVPCSTPPVKVARLRRFGAEVTVIGDYYADAYEASADRAAETGALTVHSYDQPEVCAGQGTVGVELAQQVPDLDTVLVGVGGGGLMAGVATWMAPATRVVAVEPQRCPTLSAALASGRPVDVEVGGVAADSLGARRIGAIALEAALRYDVSAVLVSDEAILEARRVLWADARLATEPGGVAALAALTSGAYRPEAGERVAVVLSGANTDPATLDG
ncbi:MAG: threonine/serine dehydratase [Acidimicrobiales bacterium]